VAAQMNATPPVPQWELDLLDSPEYAARQAALTVLTRKADIDHSDQSTAWLVPHTLLVELVTAAVDAARPILEQTAREKAARKVEAMPKPTEAIYDLACEAFKRAPLGSSIVRAIVDFVWPVAGAEARRQAAANIRVEGVTFDTGVDRTSLVGAEAAYAGVTDPVQLGYKAVWLMAEQEGESSNVRFCWQYVTAALEAAREAAARLADGTARPAVSFLHPCGWSVDSVTPQTCPYCGTAEPWSRQ
jgi:hypothetical protein